MVCHCVNMKIHHELFKYLYGQSHTPRRFSLHLSPRLCVYRVRNFCRHVISLLYGVFKRIICVVEKTTLNVKWGIG